MRRKGNTPDLFERLQSTLTYPGAIRPDLYRVAQLQWLTAAQPHPVDIGAGDRDSVLEPQSPIAVTTKPRVTRPYEGMVEMDGALLGGPNDKSLFRSWELAAQLAQLRRAGTALGNSEGGEVTDPVRQAQDPPWDQLGPIDSGPL